MKNRWGVPVLGVAMLGLVACDLSQKKPKVALIFTGSPASAAQLGEARSAATRDSLGTALSEVTGKPRTTTASPEGKSNRLYGPGISPRLQTHI